MGSDWVPPAVTGAVGVVGVAATYFTSRGARISASTEAREQREHEEQVRLRNEKRDAYLGYLEALSEARRTVSLLITLGPSAPKEERSQLRTAALALMSTRRDRLRLVAPQRLRELAKVLQDEFSRALRTAFTTRMASVDNRLEAAVLATMKQDLGYELSEFDLEVLDWAPEPAEELEVVPNADSPRTEESQ